MGFEETDEIIKEHFKPLLWNYQEREINKMSDSGFIFDYVNGLSFSCHKTILNWSGSYIVSHYRIENRKVTINSMKVMIQVLITLQ